ncbi:hypothetical protein QJS10_CPB21g00371 [Acorus calamus]|uniref:Uncharacterized protein n=1 Tax=Acorus calamus TaxID=4465 RepID=A0AAV9C674_ACOCL|nr:hypothetical protein QJS10_CPB21g00371 [Acorus calamus]
METMMRERESLGFRTPQHPSMGSNNWGGASPLLARNIPVESLDTKYLRFHAVRMRDDEIFPVDEDLPIPPPPSRPRSVPMTPRPGFLSKLTWGHNNNKNKVLGSTRGRRRRWLPAWDFKNRWPQGW